MKKILILVLSCNHPVYRKIIDDGIDKTWNSISYPNTQTFYYYGNSTNTFHDDKNIYVTSADSYQYIIDKTLETFEYCLNHFDFDYIFRTNNSSYVNKSKLCEWLADKPNEKFYSGVIGRHGNIDFASGSGYSISKDLVEYAVSQIDKVNRSLVDDVDLSRILNVNITRAPRQDVECNINADYDINNHFHFRCKCPHNRAVDIHQMQNIHRKILQNAKV